MNDVMVSERRPLTAAELKSQVQAIQQVMAAVMKKDVHYGVIPGTKKPTLYKPGSEIILTTFHIGVDPSGDSVTDLSTPDEIRYRVAARGFSQVSGVLLGVGVGECSSSEEKYKWRKPVCDQEFEETPEDRKRTVWKTYDGKPYQQKQVRTNPSDVANTILKMAKKRAQIDMTLTVTAASDVFDQDLEDLPEGMVGENGETKPPVRTPQKKETPKPTEAAQVVTVNVKEVDSKDGEKNGKPYTIYTITDVNDTKYATFDTNFADLARSAIKGMLPVTITFTVGKYGNKVSNLTLEQREAGQDG